MASRSWISMVMLLALVSLPFLTFAQAKQPQTPPRRNPPRAPSPRRAPPPPVSAEPTMAPTPGNVILTPSPAPTIASSLPPTIAPIVAPSLPPTIAPIVAPIQAPTPSGGSQCPKQNVIALSVCTRLDLSTLLNNPTKARQDCCPPINSLSTTDAAGCMCEAFKFNIGVVADVLFIKTVLNVCGKAVLGSISCSALL
uniref:Hydrophobic seed protein domain-containing protein n=1 Tax=Leersia perrieri TaxID=77586 RepID=A0A0D9XZ78_9ORYZ